MSHGTSNAKWDSLIMRLVQWTEKEHREHISICYTIYVSLNQITTHSPILNGLYCIRSLGEKWMWSYNTETKVG